MLFWQWKKKKKWNRFSKAFKYSLINRKLLEKGAFFMG
jgi:hypothetical protein